MVVAVAISVLVAPPSARAGIPICDVTASATNALIGDQVTFTGTGFVPNTAISVFGQLDAGPLTLAASGTTDGAGTFVFTATMPAVGVVTVLFETNGCSDSTAVTVTCIGDVTASATNGLVGDPVTFTGTGFAPNTAISVFGQLDAGPLTPAANGMTNGAGTFVFTTTAPRGRCRDRALQSDQRLQRLDGGDSWAPQVRQLRRHRDSPTLPWRLPPPRDRPCS